MTTSTPAIAALGRSWTVLVTTYKRDGTPVATPVNLAVEGDRAYFRSYAKAWKTKRLAHNPHLEVAPCTVRGTPRGPALLGTARLVQGEEETHAKGVIARRHPLFQRFVIPALHRLARYTSLHYEVTRRERLQEHFWALIRVSDLQATIA